MLRTLSIAFLLGLLSVVKAQDSSAVDFRFQVRTSCAALTPHLRSVTTVICGTLTEPTSQPAPNPMDLSITGTAATGVSLISLPDGTSLQSMPLTLAVIDRFAALLQQKESHGTPNQPRLGVSSTPSLLPIGPRMVSTTAPGAPAPP